MENVLTIAGSDSLAGGGLQADLKTFEEMDTFGFSAITSVIDIFPQEVKMTSLAPELLEQQLASIFDQVNLSGIKIGLLGNIEMVGIVSRYLEKTAVPVVVDPVFFFKEGSLDSQNSYIEAVKQKLLPKATITTPNLLEAQQLSGIKIDNVEKLAEAAKMIQALGCPNVVIKGGTRLASQTAVDYLLTEDNGYLLEDNKVKTTTINGAGCTFSAGITALLARGTSVIGAVKKSKAFVHEAIVDGVRIGNSSGSVYQGAARREDHDAKK